MVALKFFAITFTALALVPSGAHLLEMTHKLALARDDYVIVQGIYRGWALTGFVLIGALLANLALSVALRRQRLQAMLSLAATAAFGAMLAIFFTWTYPANVATANWTVAPPDWAALRAQWEWSHAANALVAFIALCLTVAAAISART